MNASQNTTRRKFLKSTAALAGGALASKLTTGEVTYAGGSDIIRVGMIGCGGRNTGAAAQALTADPGTRLVAMCDIFMDRVKSKRRILKEQKKDQVTVDDDHCFAGFDGYKHVIESSDVVVIANAAKFHPLHSMTAIKAGKHVFVEKPHGIDPAGVKLMQQAADLAKQKGLCIVSGLHSRYHTGYAETVQRIQDGAIGDVVAIEENFLRGPYGVIERKAGLTELQWQCSTQYHFRWLSGDDVPPTGCASTPSAVLRTDATTILPASCLAAKASPLFWDAGYGAKQTGAGREDAILTKENTMYSLRRFAPASPSITATIWFAAL